MGAPAPLRAGAHRSSSSSLALARASRRAGRGHAVQARADCTGGSALRFLGAGKWSQEEGGRGDGRGARETGERGRGGGGGRREGGGRAADPRTEGTPGAQASVPRRVLAVDVSIAPRGKKWRVWPRAAGRAPPVLPSPAVADRARGRHARGAARPGRGAVRAGPREDGREGGRGGPGPQLLSCPGRLAATFFQVPPLPPGAAARLLSSL